MSRMITGFNTDIKHKDRIFHVQTEDKGIENPMIESLIYMGGKIVHRHHYQYAWLLREGYSEKAVQELVDMQHRKIIRDIQGGKHDPEGPPVFGSGIIGDRDFDDLVLEFVEGLVASEGIEIVPADPPSPRSGDLLVLDLLVRSDVRCKPVDRARVTVKARRPERKRAVTLFDGKTDDDGKVRAGVEIPENHTGGAVIVEATCSRGKDKVEWEIGG